jgi:tRNA nucleotidyltransferase (CCA-adding enzyme)
MIWRSHPYYLDTVNGKDLEISPVFDVTFDVQGTPIDRSPTHVVFHPPGSNTESRHHRA